MISKFRLIILEKITQFGASKLSATS